MFSRMRYDHGNRGIRADDAYSSWCSMKQRCDNPNSWDYPKYGARGIAYCDSWKKYENFYADMGSRPEGCTLDRIDGTKGYCPENCRWATIEEQNNNKSDTVFVNYDGEKMPVSVLAKKLDISRITLKDRLLRKGWSMAKTIAMRGDFLERRMKAARKYWCLTGCTGRALGQYFASSNSSGCRWVRQFNHENEKR